MKKTLVPAVTPIGLKEVVRSSFDSFYSRSTVEQFEEEFCNLIGTKHAIAFSSGRASLYSTLKALASLNGPTKNEVIIPAYTCPSVAAAVVKAGLKVVLVDIKDDFLEFDLSGLRNVINNRTLCIIAIHQFGVPCGIKEIIDLAREKNIIVLEDVAQALGAIIDGKKVGTFGDAAFFSFGRGKPLTTLEGGMVVTNSDEIANMIRKSISLHEENVFDIVGFIAKVAGYAVFTRPYSYRMVNGLSFLKIGVTTYSTAFPVTRISRTSAVLGNVLLKRLDFYNAVRHRNGTFLYNQLRGSNIKMIDIPNNVFAVYNRFPFLANNEQQRERLYTKLSAKGLGVSKAYPFSLGQITELKQHFAFVPEFKSADKISKTILTLPTHSFVTQKDLDTMIELIHEG